MKITHSADKVFKRHIEQLNKDLPKETEGREATRAFRIRYLERLFKIK